MYIFNDRLVLQSLYFMTDQSLHRAAVSRETQVQIEQMGILKKSVLHLCWGGAGKIIYFVLSYFIICLYFLLCFLVANLSCHSTNYLSLDINLVRWGSNLVLGEYHCNATFSSVNIFEYHV